MTSTRVGVTLAPAFLSRSRACAQIVQASLSCSFKLRIKLIAPPKGIVLEMNELLFVALLASCLAPRSHPVGVGHRFGVCRHRLAGAEDRSRTFLPDSHG